MKLFLHPSKFQLQSTSSQRSLCARLRSPNVAHLTFAFFSHQPQILREVSSLLDNRCGDLTSIILRLLTLVGPLSDLTYKSLVDYSRYLRSFSQSKRY